jgi:ABC-type nitrate/sulfonate/bicarbonate transport system ATPase subunit
MSRGSASPHGSPAAPALELRKVSKQFAGGSGSSGRIVAVEDIDLVVRGGEFVSLIGPSGCGKSTLFNIVAGLDDPTGGQVMIGGGDLADRLGATSYMPQHDALLPWRRVLDNVVLPLELQGVPRRQARLRARPLLERFGLGEFGSAWPWQLSGGMRQRAAFLRTVMSGRSLMLLDEPFGALDGITRADLQVWLSEVWSEYKTTVLLVTHDITEAVFLSDRVFVMTPRPGRIACVLDVDLPRPRTLAQREQDSFMAVEGLLRHELHAAMALGGEFSEAGARLSR